MVQPQQPALDTPVIAGTLYQDGTGIPVRWKSAGAVPERLPLPDGVSPQGQILDMEQDGTMLGRIGVKIINGWLCVENFSDTTGGCEQQCGSYPFEAEEDTLPGCIENWVRVGGAALLLSVGGR